MKEYNEAQYAVSIDRINRGNRISSTLLFLIEMIYNFDVNGETFLCDVKPIFLVTGPHKVIDPQSRHRQFRTLIVRSDLSIYYRGVFREKKRMSHVIYGHSRLFTAGTSCSLRAARELASLALQKYPLNLLIEI